MAICAPVKRYASLLLHVAIRSLVFLAAAGALVGAAQASLKDYPFRITAVNAGQHREVIAENAGPATISVHLTRVGESAPADGSWPMTRAVPPRSSVRLTQLPLRDPAKTSPEYKISIQYGDYRAAHAPGARYRLPYEDGRTYLITQAYGDVLTSHSSKEAHYAIDIAMPERTPIVAARDGLVIDVTLDYRWGDPDPRLLSKANCVAILHDDGTVAIYAHLAQRESPVKVGQQVTAGTVIGYSGNTGYSSGPHLHFAITRPHVNDDGALTQYALPFTFYDDWKGEFAPRKGMLATAYAAQGLVAGGKTSVTPTVQQTAGATNVHPTSAHAPFAGASASAQPLQHIATADAPQREPRNVVAVVTPIAPVTVAAVSTGAGAAASAERAVSKLAARPTASRVAVEEASGWSALELTFGACAMALMLLFAFRSWSQGNLGRNF